MMKEGFEEPEEEGGKGSERECVSNRLRKGISG